MKNILSILALTIFGSLVTAQVGVNIGTQNTVSNSNVALDLSSSFSTEAGAGANVGKGIVIPSVDLVNFAFDLTLADGTTFPTYFDGMIVYNKSTGTTLTTGNRSSTATAVTPGFYYFYNPNGGINSNVTAGVWRPIGGTDPKVNIGSAETVTNTSVNGNQVYARRGTFTTNGSSTSPTTYSNQVAIASPGSLYRITIYQSGTNNVYSNSVYSYAADGTFITGSPSMSVVYPSGTYNYTIEYTKTNN